MGERAVFLDRDGVLVQPPLLWARRISDLKVLPGVPRALREIGEAGYRIFVVTNQPWIGLGILKREEVQRLHEALLELLVREGGRIEEFLVSEGFLPWDPRRKPHAGLLVEASRRWGIDPGASWVVGDKRRDVEAGRRFKARTILLHRRPLWGKGGADFVASDLSEASRIIRENT